MKTFTQDLIKVRAMEIQCKAHPEWGTFGVMEDNGSHIMFYTLDTVLHSLHTVKQGSELEKTIFARSAKSVNVKRHKHLVFTSATDAKTAQAMLILNGNQS